jgi:hypothetical protein
MEHKTYKVHGTSRYDTHKNVIKTLDTHYLIHNTIILNSFILIRLISYSKDCEKNRANSALFLITMFHIEELKTELFFLTVA